MSDLTFDIAKILLLLMMHAVGGSTPEATKKTKKAKEIIIVPKKITCSQPAELVQCNPFLTIVKDKNGKIIKEKVTEVDLCEFCAGLLTSKSTPDWRTRKYHIGCVHDAFDESGAKRLIKSFRSFKYPDLLSISIDELNTEEENGIFIISYMIFIDASMSVKVVQTAFSSVASASELVNYQVLYIDLLKIVDNKDTLIKELMDKVEQFLSVGSIDEDGNFIPHDVDNSTLMESDDDDDSEVGKTTGDDLY